MEAVSRPAHETMLRWWQATGAGIATRSATDTEIARIEAKYHIVLPPAFREYLGAASPIAYPSWDNELTNWWPCDRLTNVAEGYDHELARAVAHYRNQLILFADYSIWCWAWAINCAPGADYGKVAVISEKDRFVCDSFTGFVEAYTADPFSVGP